ncbi:C-type lectin domain-containing protein 141-like [Uranotaenia lowii]|uniref:C-type lectin domain-containing protein 141-like n=1 Tax=Uranotaenia lowii TaxID=190385 RepID=UPI002479B4AC|nr:C-type lectin domain-containing protein 141-like [Uranotaenia lowii]
MHLTVVIATFCLLICKIEAYSVSLKYDDEYEYEEENIVPSLTHSEVPPQTTSTITTTTSTTTPPITTTTEAKTAVTTKTTTLKPIPSKEKSWLEEKIMFSSFSSIIRVSHQIFMMIALF